MKTNGLLKSLTHSFPSLVLLFAATFLAADVNGSETDFAVDWGKIEEIAEHPGCYWFIADRVPDSGKLLVPAGFPQLLAAVCKSTETSATDLPLEIELNQDATQVELVLPELSKQDAEHKEAKSLQILVTTSEKTQQFTDGRVTLTANNAKVVGAKAKLESHPGNDRIGFWSDESDFVTWTFNATRWGMYDVVLTYSTASPDGTEIEVEVAQGEQQESLSAELKSTGSWYRYSTVNLGKVYLETSGEFSVAVRCKKKVGGAVMNLKGVTLLPACEGEPPVQAKDGSVLLHGKDATVYGVTLRYEPAEKKQTLGYWAKASDVAQWQFTVLRPGTFEVEVWQGCGKGQGGSAVEVRTGNTFQSAELQRQSLTFEVEDTGHFQNFQPRVIGKLELSAGQQTLSVQPTKIAKNAACDIRQIKLVPLPEK